MVCHGKSSPYHPQANGQAEIANQEIESILTKIVVVYKKDWANHLLEAIWAYSTTWKTTIRFTPFDLVYGKSTAMLIEFQHKTLCTTLDLDIDITNAQED